MRERDFEIAFILDFDEDMRPATFVIELRTVKPDYWFSIPWISLLEDMLHEDVRESEFEKSGTYVVSVFHEQNQTEVSFTFKDYEMVDGI